MDVSVTGISSRHFSWTSSDPHRSRFKLRIAVLSVTGISSRHFSWTSSDTHRSRFKLRIAVLSVLCLMFHVYCYYTSFLTFVFRKFTLKMAMYFDSSQLSRRPQRNRGPSVPHHWPKQHNDLTETNSQSRDVQTFSTKARTAAFVKITASATQNRLNYCGILNSRKRNISASWVNGARWTHGAKRSICMAKSGSQQANTLFTRKCGFKSDGPIVWEM